MREDLVKGYECATDKYVVVNETELEAIRLETTSTIEIVQFIDPAELDPMFLDTPYYIGPDGPVAREGLAVLLEALRRAKRLALGRVVLAGKEKLIAIRPHGKGFVFFTVRYANEVRPAATYFDDILAVRPDPAQVALAQKLIESKCRPLNVAEFSDRHQAAIQELLKAKIDGTAHVLVQHNGEHHPVIGLMEALRRSIALKTKPAAVTRRNGHRKVALAA